VGEYSTILARKITAWLFPTIEPYNTADNKERGKRKGKKERWETQTL